MAGSSDAMCADPLRLSSLVFGDELEVVIEKSAIASMGAAARAAGRRETGGILIGRYEESGRVARILEATPKPFGSRTSFFSFSRGSFGLKSLLRSRWEQGQHYVGEWHSHPGALPNPSPQDEATMRRIARDTAYQCSEPLLLIIGGAAERWTLSASVFLKNGSVLRLR